MKEAAEMAQMAEDIQVLGNALVGQLQDLMFTE